MENTTRKIEATHAADTSWKSSHGGPVKQSNFGHYKTSIHRGEGMELEIISISGGTKEAVQEVSRNAMSAPKLLDFINEILVRIDFEKGCSEGNEVSEGLLIKARKLVAEAEVR